MPARHQNQAQGGPIDCSRRILEPRLPNTSFASSPPGTSASPRRRLDSRPMHAQQASAIRPGPATPPPESRLSRPPNCDPRAPGHQDSRHLPESSSRAHRPGNGRSRPSRLGNATRDTSNHEPPGTKISDTPWLSFPTSLLGLPDSRDAGCRGRGDGVLRPLGWRLCALSTRRQGCTCTAGVVVCGTASGCAGDSPGEARPAEAIPPANLLLLGRPSSVRIDQPQDSTSAPSPQTFASLALPRRQRPSITMSTNVSSPCGACSEPGAQLRTSGRQGPGIRQTLQTPALSCPSACYEAAPS